MHHDPAVPDHRLRIALVDDDPSIVGPVREVVREAAGDEALFVRYPDGRSALEAFTTRKPDVILLDLHMPGMDGTAVLAQIRATRRLRKVPVVMLTAEAAWSRIVGVVEAGADDYVFKPFRPDTLVRVLREAIALRRARPDSLAP
jgi:DNA-binding response OmpR family regulator